MEQEGLREDFQGCTQTRQDTAPQEASLPGMLEGASGAGALYQNLAEVCEHQSNVCCHTLPE